MFKMTGNERYDPELQMYIQPITEIDLGKLRFLRWLAEQGVLEHEVFGEPIGVFAEYRMPTDLERSNARMASTDPTNS